MHSTDLPASMVPLAKATQYPNYKLRMRAVLASKGLLGAISEEPAGERTREVTAKAAEADTRGLALIQLSCADELAPVLAECKSAKEAWAKLAILFKPAGLAQRNAMRRAFNSMAMRPGESIVAFVARVRQAARELQAITGAATDDEDVVGVILCGLPPAYTALKNNLLLTLAGSTIDYDVLTSQLVDVEVAEALAGGDQAEESVALYSGAGPSSGGRFSGAGPSSGGHMECTFCSRRSHNTADCRIMAEASLRARNQAAHDRGQRGGNSRSPAAHQERAYAGFATATPAEELARSFNVAF
jgi:hypothetical protein